MPELSPWTWWGSRGPKKLKMNVNAEGQDCVRVGELAFCRLSHLNLSLNSHLNLLGLNHDTIIDRTLKVGN